MKEKRRIQCLKKFYYFFLYTHSLEISFLNRRAKLILWRDPLKLFQHTMPLYDIHREKGHPYREGLMPD